jgi:type 1 fimbriae regulatory protein FimB/type 1 fimbriae regulatory protein FimE
METDQTLRIEQLPTRPKNLTLRDREHLTKSEIDILLKRCKEMPRNAQRNYCLILLGYKHGLRAVEFTYLKWESVDFEKGNIYIRRAKGSDSGTHHLSGQEIRELRKLKKITDFWNAPYIFLGENGSPLGVTAVSAIVKRLGVSSGKHILGFPIHAHMLRHTCGFLLTEAGTDLRLTQAWLGHLEIQNTTKYTKLSSHAFKSIDI